ncbi:MAG: hypothetical protein ACOY9J_13180 [Pseudomonadota bacterium]
MIKGLAITPPVLGRISIGRVVEKNGKRLPEKDDQFTITTQVQVGGAWVPHPYDEELRKNAPNGKLRSIPVRMLFNDPDLNLRAEYSMFDRQTGRPICVGNGDTCRRVTSGSVQSLPCPSPDACELAKGGMCKSYGRLNVRIGDDDELGTFIFRTTGFNSIRTLAARLSYYKAVSRNLLACLPLELRLRGKSTTQSHRGAIYYVDLAVREGITLEAAVTEAKDLDTKRRDAGLDQEALDAAAQAGFSNAAFEFTEEEGPEILEEFYPPTDTDTSMPTAVAVIPSGGLRQRLGQRTSTPIAQAQG